MTRVLRAPGMAAPISVPGPAAWGPVAVAAHDQGYAQGLAEGRAEGRQDLTHAGDELRLAVTACLAAVDDARRTLSARVVDIAELMLETVLRHQADTATAGLLVRLRETLDGLDPGRVQVTVHPDLVPSVRELLAVDTPDADVSPDTSLALGEFRIATDWASADATWPHYVDAAREAVAMHVAALTHSDT